MKRKIVVMVCILTLFLGSTCYAYLPNGDMWFDKSILKVADVNGDGYITSTDFALLQRFILGMIDRFPAAEPSDGYMLGDLNHDGRITSTDFALLQRILLSPIHY